jgi:hypothetical protein
VSHNIVDNLLDILLRKFNVPVDALEKLGVGLSDGEINDTFNINSLILTLVQLSGPEVGHIPLLT